MNSTPSRFLLGGLIVFVGVVLLLDQMGIGYGIGKLWPLVIVCLGIYMIVTNSRNMITGLFVLVVGILLQLSSLDLLPFSVWNLWPLFIIFAGVSMLLGKRDRSNSSVESGYINSNAVFWADEKIVKGDFKGASLNASFGGIKLDLRDATIETKAVIDINLMFGGVELVLPDNVRVVNNGTGIFGGFSEKSRRVSNEADAKTVEINGTAIFGGVEVK